MIKPALPFLLMFLSWACFAQAPLSHQQAVEDIDFYIRQMRASHYNPYASISQAAYDARVEKIKSTIGDTISVKDFLFLCYRVTALLNDAHSTPQLRQPVLQEEWKQAQFFPYKLLQDKGRVYASAKMGADPGIAAGTEIVSINGVNTRKLLTETYERIAGVAPFKQEAATKLFSYFLFLDNIKPPFTLGYVNNKGEHATVVIKAGVPFKNALLATMPNLNHPFDLNIMEHKLGYLAIGTLNADTSNFRQFLDSAFRQFRRDGIKNIAIDLRENSGGNTLLGDMLFGYITDKKYAWGNKSWKISQVYKQQLIADGDSTSPYLTKENGTVWESTDGCVPVANQFQKDTVFQGNVFFITGPFTFSSAMAVADVVKEYKLGKIIGAPVGENVMDFGEAFTIKLPNSKINIQSTTSFSHGVNCKTVKNGPVQPDILVERKLQDEVTERDVVLDYLLKTTE